MPDEIDDFGVLVDKGWTPNGVANRLRAKGVSDEEFIGRVQRKMTAALARRQPQQTFQPPETSWVGEGLSETGLIPLRAGAQLRAGIAKLAGRDPELIAEYEQEAEDVYGRPTTTVGHIAQNALPYVIPGLSPVAIASGMGETTSKFEDRGYSPIASRLAATPFAAADAAMAYIPGVKGALTSVPLSVGSAAGQGMLDTGTTKGGIDAASDPLSLAMAATPLAAHGASALKRVMTAPPPVSSGAAEAIEKARLEQLARQMEQPVDRGLDPVPGIGEGVRPAPGTVPAVPEQILNDVRARMRASDELPPDGRVPEPKGGFGSEADIVKRIETPKPVSVTPDENQIDVILRNRERIDAADQRAVALGVNTEVNAATSTATRKALSDLGLDDPRAPVGKIPEIQSSGTVDVGQPERTIVTSDPIGAAEGRRRADFDAMGRRRDEQQAADAVAKPPEPENPADSRARAAENEDAMLSDDIERQVHEEAVKEIGPIGYGESAGNYMKRLQLRREEMKLRSGNAGMHFPKPESKPPKPPRTPQPKSDVGDPDNLPPISDDAKREAARIFESTDEQAPPGLATIAPAPKVEVPAADAPVVERPQETPPVVPRETPVDAPQPQKADDVVKAALKSKQEAIVAERKAEAARKKETARLREEAAAKSVPPRQESDTDASAPTKEVDPARAEWEAEKRAARSKVAETERRKFAELDDGLKPKNRSRSGGTGVPGAIADSMSGVVDRVKNGQVVSRSSGTRMSANEADSMRIKRLVEEGDEKAWSDEIKSNADELAKASDAGEFGDSWFAGIARARGGDYRRVARKLFDPDTAKAHLRFLRDTQQGQKIVKNAEKYFSDIGLSPDDAKDAVTDLMNSSLDTNRRAGNGITSIAKARNNAMDPRLDALLGRIDDPKQEAAITMTMQRRAINRLEGERELLDVGRKEGTILDHSPKAGDKDYVAVTIAGKKVYVRRSLEAAMKSDAARGAIGEVAEKVSPHVKEAISVADSVGRTLVTAGQGAGYLARTVVGNTAGVANTGVLFQSPRSFVKAFKDAKVTLDTIRSKSTPLYEKYVRDGVLVEQTSDMFGLEREALDKRSWSSKVKHVVGAAHRPGQLFDNVARLATYNLETELVRKLYPHLSPEQVHKEVASRVRAMLPTPNDALATVKSLRKNLGPFSGFVTYATEAGIRNPGNILKIRAKDAMVAKGADKALALTRLAGTFATITAIPLALENGSKEYFGISDEDEQALRERSGFARNDVLLFLGKDDAVSLSRVLPTALLHNTLYAASNVSGREKTSDVLKDTAAVAVSTAIGGPVGSAAMDAIDSAMDSRFADAMDAINRVAPKWIREKDPLAAIDPTTALPDVVPDDSASAEKRFGFEASLAKTEEKYDYKRFFNEGGGREAASEALKDMGDNYDRLIASVGAFKKTKSTEEMMALLAKSVPRAKDRIAIINGERPSLPSVSKFILKQGTAELRRRSDLLSLDPKELRQFDRKTIREAYRAKEILALVESMPTNRDSVAERAIKIVDRELKRE